MLKISLQAKNTQHRYTPPYSNRTNPSERALQTYKSCVKSTMTSLPPTFPIAYWCRLLPQIDFSVNIVRKCRQNPLLSEWAFMEGEFHFNATPIAPPGSEMLMHEKPNRRKTFGFNTKKAWYIAPCFKHYQTFKGIMASTGAERLSDTVRFKHHDITTPHLTPADIILESAQQLDSAIKQHPKKAPMDELVAKELLRKIILGEKNSPPTAFKYQKQTNIVIDAETSSRNQVRRNKRLPAQDKQDGCIECLAAKETASIPDLNINSRNMTKRLGQANTNLQLNEWAYQKVFRRIGN